MTSTAQKKRLVVIDDSPVETMIFETLAEKVDCDAFITVSFEQAKQYCQQHTVDVLVSDLNIGDKSGFDIIVAANSNPDNQGLKSFICSSESPEQYRDKMQSDGVTAWIVKPIKSEALLKMLKRLLE